MVLYNNLLQSLIVSQVDSFGFVVLANDLRDIDLDHDGTTLTDYTINDIPQTVFDRMAKLNEPEYDTFSLTSYNQKSSIIDHAQNGYGMGSLRNSVDRKSVV